MSDLTPDERRAIASLKRLAKRWPKSLWLFSASGSLNVMRCGADGARVHQPDDGRPPERWGRLVTAEHTAAARGGMR